MKSINSPTLPFLQQAQRFTTKTAVIDPSGEYTYAHLLEKSEALAQSLCRHFGGDLAEKRIAFMALPGVGYPITLWGIWRAGGIAVPLFPGYPPASLAYFLTDSQTSALLVAEGWQASLEPLGTKHGIPLLPLDALLEGGDAALPTISTQQKAMMVYTSGTTSRPKGVVSTHGNIEAQIRVLVEAWRWQPSDHILHVLPLHHVHGIINVLGCALWAGACCEFLPKFDAAAVWAKFIEEKVTLFMAVPTIYHRLIEAYQQATPDRQDAMRDAGKHFRLMVSGSAALPVSVLEKWKAITGHTLLERYGMTEIGMALSNPYEGQRLPGHVGQPLPGVEIRLVDEQGRDVPEGKPGEIWVKSPTVFLEYWNKPEATKEAFKDGWFQTGDTAICKDGNYRILGRNSVDIIKSGGYKISALEIEEVYRKHPAIADCAVVGLTDDAYGETVAMAVVGAEHEQPDGSVLRSWAETWLPTYKIPRTILWVDELPRNQLGKVMKPAVKALFMKGG